MKVEHEIQGNTTFVFPHDEVDVAESFLAEAVRYFASIGSDTEQARGILKAIHEHRMKSLN